MQSYSVLRRYLPREGLRKEAGECFGAIETNFIGTGATSLSLMTAPQKLFLRDLLTTMRASLAWMSLDLSTEGRTKTNQDSRLCLVVTVGDDLAKHPHLI